MTHSDIELIIGIVLFSVVFSALLNKRKSDSEE